MRGPRRLYRRFLASTRGVAAIEFGMIMPVLLLMFLASVDGGRAISIYMKVRSATFSLASITNQYQQIQAADMQLITGATSVVLSPYASAPASVVISQIVISTSGQATVSWSYSPTGTARTQGSSVAVPTAFITPNTKSYLIFAEVSYQYTPLFGYFYTSAFTLADNLYVTPRSSPCIWYAPENVTSC